MSKVTSQQIWHHWKGMLCGIAAMAVIVTASNYLVEIPINDWLTWGALTYPIAFLITDTTNRNMGPKAARQVIYVGFAVAVLLSYHLADERIAIASGTAFLVAQLLDVTVFNRLRRLTWWKAPLISSALGSTLDTVVFFTLAFAGTGLPWVTWGLGDLGVKFAVAMAMLVPFRMLMSLLRPVSYGEQNA